MSTKSLRAASWVAGLLGLLAVVYFYTPTQFTAYLREIGYSGAIAWLVLTLVARLLLVELTVAPLALLDYRLRRADAFWIGWIRTLANQILPLSGLALYAHQLRRKSRISWSKLASLSTPQFFLAALATGLVGIAATTVNFHIMGKAAYPTLIAFTMVCCVAAGVSTKTTRLIEMLPAPLASRMRGAAQAFTTLSARKAVLSRLFGLNLAIVLVRGARILLLFFAAGCALDWRASLLIVAIAESATMFQLTPGGLGLREGAIVGAAILLQIPAETAAAIALIDRLFVTAITILLAAPAIYFLHCHGTRQSD